MTASTKKVTFIGAGSFVFGPSMLFQALAENRLDNLEIALFDPDDTMCSLMVGVGQRIARDAGLTLTINAVNDRAAALKDANFVICMAARQLLKRFEMDVEIIRRLAPGHLITEFGGIAGISSSLRQMGLISEIAEDMRHNCPDGWLLNVANPLPRVCQVAHAHGIKTVGFCSVALEVYNIVGCLFGSKPEPYPFTKARERWSITTAGLNHFTWVTQLIDRATGEDQMTQLRERVAAGATSGNPVSEALLLETGALLVPNDGHTADFLRPSSQTPRAVITSHGSPDERQRRIDLLSAVGKGEAPINSLLEHPSWERPFDLIGALAYGRPAEFHSLNLINKGQNAALPGRVFVETPCQATEQGIVPQIVTLPETVVALCQRTALVTDTIVRAFQQRSQSILHQAVELDPTVIDKSAGITAINACLKAHADIVPPFQG